MLFVNYFYTASNEVKVILPYWPLLIQNQSQGLYVYDSGQFWIVGKLKEESKHVETGDCIKKYQIYVT